MNDVPDQSTNEQKPKPLISKKWILLKTLFMPLNCLRILML